MTAGASMHPTRWATAAVAIVIALIVMAFWAPALFAGKTHFIGDAIGHSLPLMDWHSQALHGAGSLLWSDNIYGGHPLFAEGQGAFAHPLNTLFAWLVPPLYGASLFHCVGMLLMAWGCFGLCRCLGASIGAAGFAALVAVFSGATIGVHHNMTIGGAAIWLPWVFWGMEAWLRQPTVLRAVLWGGACCLCILAGYPHLFHGAVVYMVFALLVRFGFAAERAILARWREYVLTGLLAAIVCVGLAAVQLLPLFELAGESHRSAGTGMLPASPNIKIELLRGLLFSGVADPQKNAEAFAFVGSLLMATAALLALVTPTSAKIKAHIVATFVLLQLSMGGASPLFVFAYDHDLVPGIKYFRWSWPYLVVTVTGIAVLAAAGVDGLSAVLRNMHTRNARFRLAAAGALIVVIAAVALRLYSDALSPWSPIMALAALLLVVVLVAAGRRNWVPGLLFMLLALEVSLQHTRDFQFGDVALLAPPATRSHMAAQDDLTLYRTYYLPGTLLLYGLADYRTADLPAITSSARGIYSHLTGLMYDVPSFSGALALPLRRRALLEPLIVRELKGDRDVAARGLRAIDLLSLRYVAADANSPLPGFETAFRDERSNWWFLKNNAAKPRVQTYTRARAVTTPEAALQALAGLVEDELIVEAPMDAVATEAGAGANDAAAIRWTLRSASAVNYVIDIDADRAGWVFLADANYPGWRARIDGEPAPLYSAQVLGKAVAVPPGRHSVEIAFHPTSFFYGRMITIASLIAALICIACAWWRVGPFVRHPS